MYIIEDIRVQLPSFINIGRLSQHLSAYPITRIFILHEKPWNGISKHSLSLSL